MHEFMPPPQERALMPEALQGIDGVSRPMEETVTVDIDPANALGTFAAYYRDESGYGYQDVTLHALVYQPPRPGGYHQRSLGRYLALASVPDFKDPAKQSVRLVNVDASDESLTIS